MNRQRNERIAQQRREGMTLREIGEKHGLTHARVSQICAEMGVKSSYKGTKRDDPDLVAEIMRRYPPRDSMRKIAKDLGLSLSMVHMIINRERVNGA